MSITELLRRRWLDLLAAVSGDERYWRLTPTNRAMRAIIEARLAGRHFTRVLDVGAGTLAFRRLLQPHAGAYLALDRGHTAAGLDLVANGCRLPFPDGAFTLVFCSAVIEHVPDPARLVHELYRVTALGGSVLLTAPHVHYLHAEPHDYWRFTRHGLTHLLRGAGFAENTIRHDDVGYPVNFLISTLVPVLAGTLRLLGLPCGMVAAVLSPVSRMGCVLDRIFAIPTLPLGTITMAEKQ